MTGQDYKNLRKSKGVTTYQLQKAGIGVNTYYAIENDLNYTKKSLDKYLDVLANIKPIL